MARQVERTNIEKQPLYFRTNVKFDTNDVANGVDMELGQAFPSTAFITNISVEIVTAFNAGTTNVLTVGSATDGDALVAAGDVNEGATGVTAVTTGLGKVASAYIPRVTYTQSGTAATAGEAEIVITYVD